ncbi:uncharacterized protein LOC132257243 isoform X2 [Phlebotomus argentipes]|uniref:uncharacterized protein LOC132257243 isoform X2 n=1 Tax=Phlebotomus argentipes TaxID=94469 RepID=UPI00289340BE|nr:uncharacterized protein LOC132257243 isoform X2 [Phlebotomus argentipes]
MRPFVLIREMRKQDEVTCEELVKNFILSGVRQAFVETIFKEITLQMIVLCWAIAFIFFGIPPLYCLLTVPGVIIGLFFLVYGTFFNKAMEIANMKPNRCWLAELHYNGISEPRDFDIFFNDPPDEQQVSKMRRKIISSISMKNHRNLHNSAWLYRFGFSHKNHIPSLGEALIAHVLDFCRDNRFSTVEGVTRECDDDLRDVYTKLGFTMKQVYHKQIVGNSLRIMKAQFGIDLEKWNGYGNYSAD